MTDTPKSRRRLKRIMILLTEAQAAWMRGAVRSWREDQAVAGMLSAADERMADVILDQLCNNPLKHIKREDLSPSSAE